MGKFVTIKDGYFYNLPSNPNVAPKKYAEITYGKGEPVSGNLVYVRYKNSFTPMIKLDKGVTSTFKYINADNVKPETSSSFTNDDTVLDLQSNMVDNDLSCHKGDLRASSFNGGAMEVFNGGDSAFDSEESSADGEASSKVEYTEPEVKALQAKSGSKLTLKEWIKSDSAKTTLSNVGKFGAGLLSGLGAGSQQATAQPLNDNVVDDGEKKILGMHPLTFGVVAISVVILSVVGFKLLSKKNVPIQVK